MLAVFGGGLAVGRARVNCFKLSLACAALGGLFVAAGPALADDNDVVSGIVGGSIGRDDNLFRLSSGTSPQAALGRPQKSSWLYTGNVGLKVDKPYGLQRFQLDLMATDYRYESASYLNWTGVDYRAAWLWQVTPKIGGVISADRQQSLASFADYRNYNTRNIQTVENQRANVDWWVDGGWHVLGGVLASESRNSATFTAVGDFNQVTAEGGVRYIARDDNSVTVSLRESRGEYRGRVIDPVGVLDNHFDQHEVEGRVVWRVTANSLFDGRLSYLERKHANFSQRDFKGPVGRLDYSWTPTAKLRFDFTAARNLYSFQEPTNSYFIASTLAFVPVWLVTEKTNLRLRFDHTERDFRGPVVPTAVLRSDTLRSAGLGVEWKATRGLTVTGDLRREQRSSNYAGFDYKANILFVKGQLIF